MIKSYATNEANRIIKGDRGCEWIHLNLGLDVPPVSAGSYKYLLWDILQERSDKDLLICKYLPDSFKIALDSDCAVCQLDILSKDLNTILNCRWNWLKSIFLRRHNDVFLETVANIVRKTKGKNILLWGGINSLPELRKKLPHHNIAYAQRHYSYRADVQFYEYCDILLVQTPGQLRYAFETTERLTPTVLTIPNGVEIDTFVPACTEEMKLSEQMKLGIPRNNLVVVFPSKVALQKGSRYLERLILKAVKELPEVSFLVIGGLHHGLPAAHRDSLSILLDNSPNTVWCKGVNRHDMPGLLQLSDICLMPAVWREGFSMAAIEAMSAGLPVVAPRSGCYLEIVEHRYNGMLCRLEYLFEDLFSAIKMYADNRQLIREMGDNSRKYVKEKLPRSKVIGNFCRFLEGDFEGIENDMSINTE